MYVDIRSMCFKAFQEKEIYIFLAFNISILEIHFFTYAALKKKANNRMTSNHFQ